MKMVIEYVSIKVKPHVHNELVSLGSYGESMSDIIEKCVRSFKDKDINKK